MDAIEKLAQSGALLTNEGWVYPEDDFCESYKTDGTCIHSDCMMKGGK